MSIIEMIGAAVGFAVIAVVLWNLRKGVAKNNGKTPEFEDSWNTPDGGHS